MPLYAFECETCGSFEEWRPLGESGSPWRCPVCRAPGRRVYTPPGLVRTPAPVRHARTLEERSAHEPDVVHAQPSGLPGRPLRRPASRTPAWATPRAVPAAARPRER
jgi:putative FmdB family regulatory protein